VNERWASSPSWGVKRGRAVHVAEIRGRRELGFTTASTICPARSTARRTTPPGLVDEALLGLRVPGVVYNHFGAGRQLRAGVSKELSILHYFESTLQRRVS